ncbi:hypothetical protein MRX96_016795 [Rhipicephalus microplus]
MPPSAGRKLERLPSTTHTHKKKAGPHCINFKHYEHLYKTGEKAQLKVVPKLTASHVSPGKLEKMNVGLATQLFSRSVALGLRFYREQREPGFEDTEGTERFTAPINELFDVLNAKILVEGIRKGSPKIEGNCTGDQEQALVTVEESLNIKKLAAFAERQARQDKLAGIVKRIQLKEHSEGDTLQHSYCRPAATDAVLYYLGGYIVKKASSEDSHVPQLESCDLDRDRSLLLNFSLPASSDSPCAGLPLCLGLRDRERDRESSWPSSRGLRDALRMQGVSVHRRTVASIPWLAFLATSATASESPFTAGLWLLSRGSLSLRLRLRLLCLLRLRSLDLERLRCFEELRFLDFKRLWPLDFDRLLLVSRRRERLRSLDLLRLLRLLRLRLFRRLLLRLLLPLLRERWRCLDRLRDLDRI